MVADGDSPCVVIVGQTLEEQNMLLQIEHDNLTDAIHLRIVSSLRDTPEYVLLVFHPEAQKNLAVSGGTCFLDASTNDTHVVQIVQQPGKALCSQLILGARGLGNAIVTIQDIGLSPRATTDSLMTLFGSCHSQDGVGPRRTASGHWALASQWRIGEGSGWLLWIWMYRVNGCPFGWKFGSS